MACILTAAFWHLPTSGWWLAGQVLRTILFFTSQGRSKVLSEATLLWRSAECCFELTTSPVSCCADPLLEVARGVFQADWCAIKLLQPDRSFIIIAGVGAAAAVSAAMHALHRAETLCTHEPAQMRSASRCSGPAVLGMMMLARLMWRTAGKRLPAFYLRMDGRLHTNCLTRPLRFFHPRFAAEARPQ